MRALAAATCGMLAGAVFVHAQSATTSPIRACVVDNHQYPNPGYPDARQVRFLHGPNDTCVAANGETEVDWNGPGAAGPTGPAGPAGPAGPTGPSGPRGAAGADADVPTHAVVTTVDGAAPLHDTTGIARCPSGEHVVSGGFRTDSDFSETEYYATQNRPLDDDTGWIVVLHDYYSKHWHLYVNAVCAGATVHVTP